MFPSCQVARGKGGKLVKNIYLLYTSRHKRKYVVYLELNHIYTFDLLSECIHVASCQEKK